MELGHVLNLQPPLTIYSICNCLDGEAMKMLISFFSFFYCFIGCFSSAVLIHPIMKYVEQFWLGRAEICS